MSLYAFRTDNFASVVKCNVLYVLGTFSLHILDKIIVKLLTIGIGIHNGVEFGQNSGFILTMIKQLESTSNLVTT